MAAFTLFNCFALDVLTAKHDFSAHTFKVALTNTAPNATDDELADITQIAGAFGYTTGGTALSGVAVSQSSGVAKVVAADLTFTAAGGAMADWRYAILYNDTSATDRLVGYLDVGGTISLADTQTHTFDFDPSTGILQTS